MVGWERFCGEDTMRGDNNSVYGLDKEPRVAIYDGQEGWEKMVEKKWETS